MLDDVQKNQYIDIIKNISKRNFLDDHCKKYALGYMESESVYSGLHTPNNTFTLFWNTRGKKNNEFPAIFPRRSSKS
jgi:hypothetical protein